MRVLALSGSGSQMTRRQIARALESGFYGIRVTAFDAVDPDKLVDAVLAEIDEAPDRVPLVNATDAPEEVRRAQDELGRECAGAVLETFFARLAAKAVERDYNAFVVAGGETSGAVVQALDTQQLLVGPEIAPGVPWARSDDLWLALKSGNFGDPDFFATARAMLKGDDR